MALNFSDIKELIGSYKIVVIDEVQRILNPGLTLKMMVDNFKDVQFFIKTLNGSLILLEVESNKIKDILLVMRLKILFISEPRVQAKMLCICTLLASRMQKL